MTLPKKPDASQGRSAPELISKVASDGSGLSSKMKQKTTQHAFAMLLLFSSASCVASTCLKYGDSTVSLQGKIIVSTFFGPPGYGEEPKTNSREKQALLVLDHPICVDAARDEPAETRQSRITLAPLGRFDLSSYIGKRLTVTGSLFHAISGHHHTSILMQLGQPPAVSQ